MYNSTKKINGIFHDVYLKTSLKSSIIKKKARERRYKNQLKSRN